MVLINRRAGLAPDNLGGLERKVRDHVLRNRTVEELIESIILILWTAWVGLILHDSGLAL